MAEQTVAAYERPILFSGPMVRALLSGAKTQTRRVIVPPWSARKLAPSWHTFYPGDRWWVGAHPSGGWWAVDSPDGPRDWLVRDQLLIGRTGFRCPYGKPGDRLWVRESFYIDDYRVPERGSLRDVDPDVLDRSAFYYRADGECCDQIPECECGDVGKPRWRPGRFMPRWASRIRLEVTDVRAERIQDVTHEAAIAEGVRSIGRSADGEPRYVYGDAQDNDPRAVFAVGWDELNCKRGFGWPANPWVWAITFRRADVEA